MNTAVRQTVPLGLAAVLALLSMISPFSIDTFFPSFRAMQAEFSVSDLTMQQTLTAYMVPYALMSLVHGPLSDALGRRPVVLWGLSLYAFASLACTFAPGFGALLAFRAVQGMTAGAGLTVGRAIVRDLYDGPEAQRLMNTVTLIFSVAPALAPVLGGWIHVAFGWRAVFFFLFVLGLAVALASWWRLPETLSPQRRAPFGLAPLLRTTWRVLATREFLMMSIAGGLNMGAVLMYIGSAPAIVLDNWHLDETRFHWLFVPIIGGFMIGAMTSGRMAGRVPTSQQVRLGFAIMIAGAACVTLLHAAPPGSPPILVQQLLMALCSIGVQIVSPVLTLRILDMFPANRGSAASVQAFVQLVVGSLLIGVLVPVLHGRLVWLTLGSLLAAAGSLLMWTLATRIAARRRCAAAT
ncbi:MAG: multidrug effflux MFS transporter [Gammaproteobacteria bacterium]|nr:multidrug effflux MFS transporter [Gammaproteobacteria bacterium]